MKKILFLLTVCCASAYGQVPCSPQLQPYLTKIEQIPEAQELIASIQKEGAIQIRQGNNSLSNTFGAFWDPDQRIINVSIQAHTTEGEIIGSLLFELHNSSVTTQFDHFDRLAALGQIDKHQYVRQMEYIEYLNSHRAAKIAEKGIQMGLLPADARLPTYHNFEEHFWVQRISGHSAWFAHNYDTLRQ